MVTSGPKTVRPTHKAIQTGVVEAVSGKNTIRVVVNHLVRHKVFDKYMRRRTRLLAHDVKSEAQVGDTVELAECRPISKRKSWRLLRVVRRATVA